MAREGRPGDSHAQRKLLVLVALKMKTKTYERINKMMKPINVKIHHDLNMVNNILLKALLTRAASV